MLCRFGVKRLIVFLNGMLRAGFYCKCCGLPEPVLPSPVAHLWWLAPSVSIDPTSWVRSGGWRAGRPGADQWASVARAGIGADQWASFARAGIGADQWTSVARAGTGRRPQKSDAKPVCCVWRLVGDKGGSACLLRTNLFIFYLFLIIENK